MFEIFTSFINDQASRETTLRIVDTWLNAEYHITCQPQVKENNFLLIRHFYNLISLEEYQTSLEQIPFKEEKKGLDHA